MSAGKSVYDCFTVDKKVTVSEHETLPDANSYYDVIYFERLETVVMQGCFVLVCKP